LAGCWQPDSNQVSEEFANGKPTTLAALTPTTGPTHLAVICHNLADVLMGGMSTNVPGQHIQGDPAL